MAIYEGAREDGVMPNVDENTIRLNDEQLNAVEAQTVLRINKCKEASTRAINGAMHRYWNEQIALWEGILSALQEGRN